MDYRQDIQVLEGLEPAKRPAMYRRHRHFHGYHHLWEIVDNSIDEVINGHATIWVTLHNGKSITVGTTGAASPSTRCRDSRTRALSRSSSPRSTRAAVQRRQLRGVGRPCTASAARW